MPNKTLTIEHVLYLAAFLLAAALRALNLGALPLSEYEAGWAMQALDLQSGVQVNIGPQPLYVIFTSLIFNLFGSGEFLARFLPLVSGLLLVPIPYFFREQLGEKAALLLCFGLAIDPTLVGLSRMAGSPLSAVAFTLSTLAAWQRRTPRLAAVFAALAMLSGPSLLTGFLSLGLAWALANFLIPDFKSPLPALEPIHFRQALFPFSAVLLVAGTALLRYPQGLSALGSTLTVYFSGWGKPLGASLSQFAFALLAYQTLALIFALLATWQAWRRTTDPLDRFLSLWLIAALLLVLSNPSRHPADLIWVILPLWALACRFIALRLSWSLQDGLPVWGQTTLTILLLTFLLMSAIRLSSVPYSSAAVSSFELFGRIIVINQQTVSLISIFTLGIVASILIGAGWSPVAASRGLVWGTTAVLAIYSLSVAWYPSQLPSRIDRELWFTSPGPANIDYLSDVIGDYSEYAAGLRTGIEVVSTHSSELLRWELRNFPQARFLSSLPEDFSPAILITAENSQNPRLSAYYRGQAIPLLETPLWSQFSASQWQRWWLFREVAFQNESVILWVRSDIFPEDYSLLDDYDPLPEAIVP